MTERVSAHRDIMNGASFTLTTVFATHIYRSYVYQRKTYVKFVRDNGSEVHLGRYYGDGMIFNAKFCNIRNTPRNRHISTLKIFCEYLQGTRANPTSYVYQRYDAAEQLKVNELIAETKDEKDYFYRIGYA